MDYRREAVVLLPNFTRQQHATVLHALTRMTGLAESALMAAFIDADVQRVAVLDPMPARTCSPEPPAGASRGRRGVGVSPTWIPSVNPG